jgi:hypothetical protein
MEKRQTPPEYDGVCRLQHCMVAPFLFLVAQEKSGHQIIVVAFDAFGHALEK